MKFFDYLKETKGEMKHVRWPSRKEIVTYTILVILISVFVAIYLGFFDQEFTRLIKNLI